MVVPSFNTLQTYNGGQMTDLPEFDGPFDGTELFELVAPGNVEEGINYSVNLAQLAAYIIAPTPTFVTSGPTYASVATDVRILVDLAVAGPLTITLLGSGAYLQPILVKDIGGTCDGTNTITVVFTGGETMDGLTTVVLSNPYAWFWFNPLEAGNFYET